MRLFLLVFTICAFCSVKAQNAQPTFELGMKYATEEKYDSAIKYLSMAIEIRPLVIFYYNRAMVFMQLKRNMDAINDLTQVVYRGMNEYKAMILIGTIYASDKNYTAALRHYYRSLNIYASSEAYLRACLANFELGNISDAIRDYQEARTFSPEPNDSTLFFEIGLQMGRNEKDSLAISCYDECLKLTPSHLYALCNRGIAWLNLKNYEMALIDFNTVLGLKPDFPDIQKFRKVCLIEKFKQSK